MDTVSSEDDYDTPTRHPLEFQDWSEWFDRDLMNMWMSLRQYREDTYLTGYILRDATFTDFCDFCYQFSHGCVS